MKSKLGWGSFSTVWKCEDREEGCFGVAVKVVQSEQIATAMAKDEVHCAHMGPHLGDPVPMGTFFSFWVPIFGAKFTIGFSPLKWLKSTIMTQF